MPRHLWLMLVHLEAGTSNHRLPSRGANCRFLAADLRLMLSAAIAVQSEENRAVVCRHVPMKPPCPSRRSEQDSARDLFKPCAATGPKGSHLEPSAAARRRKRSERAWGALML